MAKKATESSGTLADSLTKAMALIGKDTGEYSIHSDAMAFRKRMIHTGIYEIDTNLRPVWGSRLQITGDPHQGKSLLCYMLMGAAHRTCRECYTPIIDFVNDWTGEVKTTCLCGACSPMKVVLFDAEVCFDPPWASKWGVVVEGVTAPPGNKHALSDKVEVSENALLTVIRTSSAEQCALFAEQIISDYTADMVVVDSLAALYPETRSEGKFMVGDHAKAITRFISALVNAQGAAYSKSKLNIAPTLILPNQLRVKIGGYSPRPGMVPKEASGGEALKYNSTMTWQLKTKFNDGVTPEFDDMHRFGDATLTVRKDKESGATGAQANYKFFTNPYTVRSTEFRSGDTDEGARMLKFVKELGDVNPLYFEKVGAKYRILGREFTTQQDIINFLARPDIVYMLRFPMYAMRFPDSLRQHLSRETFDYTPFRDDPILALYDEATKRVGTSVTQRTKSQAAVMLGKSLDKPVRGRAEAPAETGPAGPESDEQSPGQ